MKKEICIDARMGSNSGIGTYIRSLVTRIKDHYNICLIVGRESKCPEFDTCEQIPCAAPIYSVQEQWMLPLKIPKCDLFWSPHFNIPLAPIRARKRLVSIHDVFFLAHPEQLGLLKRAYARLFFNAAVRRSDHVITISDFSFSEIGKHIGPCEDKTTVIPLGVDQTVFGGKGTLVNVPSKYLLYVGNFLPHKNISRVIQSLDSLPEDVHLVLVGKETWWDGWKEEVQKRKNRVTVCGKVSQEELIWLYQNAEALVHPSYYEGFGLTPLEAMSAGCPVVVSKAASLPEVCGDAAVYVDPFCIKDIAKGIAAVWNNVERQMDLRGKGFARARLFDWDICAKRHMEVINKVLIS